MRPFVSIAIPFFNAEQFLPMAIKSVFAQTYPNWELILIDDGSTDGSLEVAKSIKDDRVRVVSDGLNKKLATRLNEVTALARYDFLVRMDADDLMAVDRIEKQMELLLQNPETDLITTGVITIKNDLTFIGSRGSNFVNPRVEQLLSKKVGVTHAAMIGKKSWWIRNPYNPGLKVAQDFSRWVESAANSDFKIMGIAEPLYYYREEGNVTTKKILKAYSYERGLICKYSNSTSKLRLYLINIVKSLVVQFLTAVDLNHLLLKRRIQLIDSALKLEYDRNLRLIKETVVPGLN